jgi:hypothetical protein
MEDGITFGSFLFLSTRLLFFGSQPGTNGVGMGFYHLPLKVEFPRAPDAPKSCPVQYRLVAGLMDWYEYVHGTFVWLLPFFPFLVQGSAAQGVCS